MPTLVTDSSILCWYSRKQDESNSSNSETKWILVSNSALLDPSHEMYFNEITLSMDYTVLRRLFRRLQTNLRIMHLHDLVTKITLYMFMFYTVVPAKKMSQYRACADKHSFT